MLLVVVAGEDQQLPDRRRGRGASWPGAGPARSGGSSRCRGARAARRTSATRRCCASGVLAVAVRALGEREDPAGRRRDRPGYSSGSRTPATVMPPIRCTGRPSVVPSARRRPPPVSTITPSPASRRMISAESWLPETATTGLPTRARRGTSRRASAAGPGVAQVAGEEDGAVGEQPLERVERQRVVVQVGDQDRRRLLGGVDLDVRARVQQRRVAGQRALHRRGVALAGLLDFSETWSSCESSSPRA